MFSRTSRILLVVALLAAGAYLLIERPHEKKADKSEATSDQLVSFQDAAIDSIVIERPADTVQLAKRGGAWQLIAPIADSAEPEATGALLHALTTASINRHLGPAEDLAPYGLDHPDAVITMLSAHRVMLQVAVGKNTVDNAWCYARMATGDVVLVPTDVHTSSTRPLEAWRDRRILGFQVGDVTAYAIRGAKNRMQWYRHDNTWYALAGGDTIPGDSVAVPSPLHRLRGLRVTSFPVAKDTTVAVPDSVRMLTMWMGAAHVSLRFVHAGSSWLVSNVNTGRLVGITDDISDLFAHTVTGLRDRRLLQFDPAVAQRISYAAPTATGELVRAGGHWSYRNPVLGRVNAGNAANFVRALRNLKWGEPGDEAARTTGRVSYRIEIAGAGDKMLDQLTGGPYDATTSWVTTRSSHGTFLVKNAVLDDVSKIFLRVKER
jgi:hypothetical protein